MALSRHEQRALQAIERGLRTLDRPFVAQFERHSFGLIGRRLRRVRQVRARIAARSGVVAIVAVLAILAGLITIGSVAGASAAPLLVLCAVPVAIALLWRGADPGHYASS